MNVLNKLELIQALKEKANLPRQEASAVAEFSSICLFKKTAFVFCFTAGRNFAGKFKYHFRKPILSVREKK
jgi:hypothetical protein